MDDTRSTRIGRGARIAKAVAVLGLILGFTGVGVSAAGALPPDGPALDYPGTSSRVWPTTVSPGDTLYFEVSGYPANEIVYIKIDDGLMCSDTSHGACVYHTQALDANGYASGSIIVPSNLPAGAHWLRMLATGDVFDPQTGKKLGYEGYPRRGGNDFTVVAGGSAGGAAGAGGGAAAPGGAAVNADGTLEGGELSLNVEDEAAENPPEGLMDGSTRNVADDTASASRNGIESSQQVDGEASQFPVLGASVLGGAVLLGGGALAWALLRGRGAGAAVAAGTGDSAGAGASE